MLASGKKLSNGKNKRTVPENKSHWAYFLFPLVVVFFLQMLLMFDAAQTGYETAV